MLFLSPVCRYQAETKMTDYLQSISFEVTQQQLVAQQSSENDDQFPINSNTLTCQRSAQIHAVVNSIGSYSILSMANVTITKTTLFWLAYT